MKWYNKCVQQLNYETGQNRKIAALNKTTVCTYFFNNNTKGCLHERKNNKSIKKIK